ncbi:hypothetical protein L6164_036045 [Bauhinia variegata]|uniref:Uncharacterized protein n=1 Tax=Bauhinia variegata TaxID=167791 RepID=A0ACB9KFW4_BAUVA|nr:hypothetical protein L6164_036045 [Bauhinia variegata]
MVSSTTPCSSPPPPPPPPPPKTPQCSPPPPPKAPHYSPPVPPTPPPSHSNTKCPIDTLKLGVCANLLGLVNVVVGSPPTLPWCSLIKGLADLEVAACLCTAIKANIIGINLDVPVALSIILNNCGKDNSAAGFQCP